MEWILPVLRTLVSFNSGMYTLANASVQTSRWQKKKSIVNYQTTYLSEKLLVALPCITGFFFREQLASFPYFFSSFHFPCSLLSVNLHFVWDTVVLWISLQNNRSSFKTLSTGVFLSCSCTGHCTSCVSPLRCLFSANCTAPH